MTEAPRFSQIWRRAERQARRRSRLRRGAAAAAGTSVLALVLWTARPPAAPTAMPDYDIAEWQAPLDFLLEVPGRGRLLDEPRFGSDELHEWSEGVSS